MPVTDEQFNDPQNYVLFQLMLPKSTKNDLAAIARQQSMTLAGAINLCLDSGLQTVKSGGMNHPDDTASYANKVEEYMMVTPNLATRSYFEPHSSDADA